MGRKGEYRRPGAAHTRHCRPEFLTYPNLSGRADRRCVAAPEGPWCGITAPVTLSGTHGQEEIAMPLSLRRSGIVAVAALVTSMGMAVPASADQAFHSQRIPLSAVTGAPLKSGAVIDIHAEGPMIYAQERYVVVGAEPETTYQVTLLIYTDPACSALLFPITTATMTTNAAGNAQGKATFYPQDVEGLPRTTYYLTWQISMQGGAVTYSTGCIPVMVD